MKISELRALAEKSSMPDWYVEPFTGDVVSRAENRFVAEFRGFHNEKSFHDKTLIASMRNHLDALLDVAECLQHAVAMGQYTPNGSTHKWAVEALKKLEEIK